MRIADPLVFEGQPLVGDVAAMTVPVVAIIILLLIEIVDEIVPRIELDDII